MHDRVTRSGTSVQDFNAPAIFGHDLALTEVFPKLFLPGLAGLTQGPGFPNLSCLGLLSDRVLGANLAHPSTRSFDEFQSVR